MTELKLRLLRPNAKPPARATAGSAGYDLAACLDGQLSIPPGETRVVPTGLALALEPGYAAFIYARSGLGVKHGIVPANGVGVVDADYRGEVHVCLRNHSDRAFAVRPGDRVAQMVIAPCLCPNIVVCDRLDDTARGAGGFGSSGLR